MGRIPSIPTMYKGITFRSKLEAKWAVYLDALGVRWDYEPESFHFKDKHLGYIPDFILYDVVYVNRNNQLVISDIWMEVKGWLDDASYRKIEALSKYYPVVVVGDLPRVKKDFTINFDIVHEEYEKRAKISKFSYSTINGKRLLCFPYMNNQGYLTIGPLKKQNSRRPELAYNNQMMVNALLISQNYPYNTNGYDYIDSILSGGYAYQWLQSYYVEGLSQKLYSLYRKSYPKSYIDQGMVSSKAADIFYNGCQGNPDPEIFNMIKQLA